MTAENGAMHHVPTLRERFARWIGYRYHLGIEPEGIEVEGTKNRLDWHILAPGDR